MLNRRSQSDMDSLYFNKTVYEIIPLEAPSIFELSAVENSTETSDIWAEDEEAKRDSGALTA